MTTIVNRTQEEKKVRVKHWKQKKFHIWKKPLSQKQKYYQKISTTEKVYIYICMSNTV